VCPRYYTRGRHVVAMCTVCNQTKNTIVHDGGICEACFRRQQRPIATCRLCHQTRVMRVTRAGLSAGCVQRKRDREAGIPERLALAPEVRRRHLIARLEPWRRPRVREFLETAYNDRKSTTQLQAWGASAVSIGSCPA
jgi:hypothetical protein